jgi:hypothetical protein
LSDWAFSMETLHCLILKPRATHRKLDSSSKPNKHNEHYKKKYTQRAQNHIFYAQNAHFTLQRGAAKG